MNRYQRLSVLVIALVLIFSCAGVAKAALFQEHPSAAEPAPAQAGVDHQAPGSEGQGQAASGPNRALESELKEESKEAAGEEGAEFKQSAVVRKLAHIAGLSPIAAYWVFLSLNFVIMIGFFWWVAKKINIGGSMRARTAMIQKGMEEARKASADANARLSSIEERLKRLDSEVATLRSSSDADFAAEEIRIKQAAEEDALRVIQSSQQEIASAAKTAQRDLKAFAAELAVDLASKKISVDSQTDQDLVRSFVEQLNDSAGKDGK